MKSFLFAAGFAAFVLAVGLAPSADANGGRLRSARLSCNCGGAALSSCYGAAVEVRVPFVRVRAPLQHAARVVTAPIRFIRSRPARIVHHQPVQIIEQQQCYVEAAPLVEYYRAPAQVRVERLETPCYQAPAQLQSDCQAPAQLRRSRIIERY